MKICDVEFPISRNSSTQAPNRESQLSRQMHTEVREAKEVVYDAKQNSLVLAKRQVFLKPNK